MGQNRENRTFGILTRSQFEIEHWFQSEKALKWLQKSEFARQWDVLNQIIRKSYKSDLIRTLQTQVQTSDRKIRIFLSTGSTRSNSTRNKYSLSEFNPALGNPALTVKVRIESGNRLLAKIMHFDHAIMLFLAEQIDNLGLFTIQQYLSK